MATVAPIGAFESEEGAEGTKMARGGSMSAAQLLSAMAGVSTRVLGLGDVEDTRSEFDSDEEFEGDEEALEFQEPDVKMAQQHWKKTLFQKGNTRYLPTGPKQLQGLGVGVRLYFLLMRNFASLFCVMGLLSIPSILVMQAGAKVDADSGGPMGLAFYSIAALAPAETPDLNVTACALEGGEACGLGAESIPVPDFGVSLTLAEMALVVSSLDFICSVLFLVYILWLASSVDGIVQESDLDSITPADYSIYVQGLPTSATRRAVKEHFNKLYDLFQEDRMQRPCCRQPFQRPQKVPESAESLERILLQNPAGFGFMGPKFKRSTAAAVSTAAYSDEPELFEGSFVADVNLVRPAGALIRRMGRLTKLHSRVDHSKAVLAKVKADGSSEKKVASVQKKLDALEAKLVQLEAKAVGVKKDEIIGAFVTFNNGESLKRCLDDYASSTSWSGRFLQAKDLRWGGVTPLEVTPAPEPSNIVWENLEVSSLERLRRQAISSGVMVLLLLVSFAVILAAKTAESTLKESVPTPALCNTHLPAAAYGGYTAVPSDWSFMKGVQQGVCDVDRPGSTAIWFSPAPGAGAPPAFNTSQACSSPCITPQDTALECTTVDGSSSYGPAAAVGCFCLQELVAAVQESGVEEGPTAVMDQHGDMCTDFAADYITLQGLVVGATITVVFINTLLSGLLTWFTKFERHMTVSAETVAVSNKVFLAQFLNTAIIMIVVNANLPVLDSIGLGWLGELGVFGGDYADVTPGWYTTVGAAVGFTLVLDTFIPHISPLLSAFVLFPCQRASGIKSALSQAELNAAFTPPTLALGQRYPLVLKAIYVVMLLSSGMPVVYFIGSALLWVMYHVEKALVLYFYSRPPAYDEQIATAALRGMPFALLLHLGLAVWMFGDPETTASSTIMAEALKRGVPTPYAEVNQLSEAGYGDQAAVLLYERFQQETAEYDGLGLLTRIVRTNTLPAFVLFALLLVGLILKATGVLALVLAILGSALRVVTCNFAFAPCLKPLTPPEDELAPPFSEYFYQLLPSSASVFTTPEERDLGWGIVPDTIRGGHLKMKVRVWREYGEAFGLQHEDGDAMRSFEVIGRTMVPTYSMAANPKYTEAARVAALSEEELQDHIKSLAKARAKHGTVLRGDADILAPPLDKVPEDAELLSWVGEDEQPEVPEASVEASAGSASERSNQGAEAVQGAASPLSAEASPDAAEQD